MATRPEVTGAKPNTEAAESDWVWGATNIGVVVNRNASQVRYLFSKGVFGKAVRKLGHKTMVGNRKLLRELTLD